MSWLTDFVRPKISILGQRKEHPEHFWTKCGHCESMLFHRDLEANHQVCTVCGHHMRLDAAGRLKLIFDDGAYTEAELPKVATDPLKFRDRKKYTDRLRDAQHKSGRSDALMLAHGTVGGRQTVVSAFDFSFMGGSMGTAVGEAFIRGAELAIAQRAPYIAIPASGGARMQEGMLSLMQMPRTLAAVQKVREAGLPYFVLFTDPTTGGVTASFAMAGDIHIAEPGATIGFAGARVIQDTIRESLPEGFQTAEYLLEHGMVDMVVKRHELHGTLSHLIDTVMAPRPSGEVVSLHGDDTAGESGEAAGKGEAKGKSQRGKERGKSDKKAKGQRSDKGDKAKTEPAAEASDNAQADASFAGESGEQQR